MARANKLTHPNLSSMLPRARALRAAMELPLFQVDAFSREPFRGNPAAVVLLTPEQASQMNDRTRQLIAAEMNLAETAFLEPADASTCQSPASAWHASSQFHLRWFTPTMEVPLCGHATLAAAAALISGCGNANDSLHFHTLSGELVVRRPQAQHLDAHAHGANQELTTVVTASAQQQGPSTAESAAQPPMQDAACRTMPASKSTSMHALELQMSLPCADPDDPVPEVASDPWASPLLQGMLGQLAGAVEDIKYCAKLGYLLLVLDSSHVSRTALEALAPDMGVMQSGELAQAGIKAVIVSVPGGADSGGFDVLSRFFAPLMGIPEDPVTGSAHAVLAPYYTSKLGKDTLKARQCSHRGGEMLVEPERPMGQRVLLTAPARLVLRGTLLI